MRKFNLWMMAAILILCGLSTVLTCTCDNAQNSRDYFKPSGYAKDHEEPLGDHFPLFATFRLK